MAALLAPFLGAATLSAEQLHQFATYLDLLFRWNARINLTAIREPEQIVTRHFGESLFTGRALYPDNDAAAPPTTQSTDGWLLDFGSGAGFPGLPIKLFRPALHVSLLESQQRKATFLREVIRALSLTNIEVFAGRAEDYVPASPIGNRQSTIGNCVVTLRAVERFERSLPVADALLDRLAPAAARRLALLIGAAQVALAQRLLPRYAWSDPLAIPQSAARVLLVGSPEKK